MVCSSSFYNGNFTSSNLVLFSNILVPVSQVFYMVEPEPDELEVMNKIEIAKKLGDERLIISLKRELEIMIERNEVRRNPKQITDKSVAFCHNCNTKVESSHRFCFQCGVFLG